MNVPGVDHVTMTYWNVPGVDHVTRTYWNVPTADPVRICVRYVYDGILQGKPQWDVRWHIEDPPPSEYHNGDGSYSNHDVSLH